MTSVNDTGLIKNEPVSVTTESAPRGGMDPAHHRLTIKVALIVLLKRLQSIVFVFEHYFSHSSSWHVDSFKRAYSRAQLLCMCVCVVGSERRWKGVKRHEETRREGGRGEGERGRERVGASERERVRVCVCV